jgi:hypothetical protein
MQLNTRNNNERMFHYGFVARGNRDPGAAGACVVRVDIHTSDNRVVWSATMSHAHRATTRTQAEYQGLVAELCNERAHPARVHR